MKKILAAALFALVSSPAFAISVDEFAGTYALTGNGGFLDIELTFRLDGGSSSVQKMADGSALACPGVYHLDERSTLTNVLHCPGDNMITQTASLAGLARKDFLRGATVKMRFQSSGGSDETVKVMLRKIGSAR